MREARSLPPHRVHPRRALRTHRDPRGNLVTRLDDASWKLVDHGPTGEVVVAGATLSLDAIYDRTDSLPGS